MKRGLLIGVGLAALLLIGIGGCLAEGYNRLVSGREEVGNQWAQVDNQLQRRSDLITNLVEAVRGVARQELAVFGEIAAARAKMAGARTPEASIEAGRAMDSALGRLLVVVENYPELKSNQAFLQLMDELAGTENRLSTARMRYNDQVRDFNVMVKRFPTNLYATAFNFHEAAYYQIPDSAKVTPRVDFRDVGKP